MKVDNEILQKGLHFLKNQQMHNGLFKEDGDVIHKEMTVSI